MSKVYSLSWKDNRNKSAFSVFPKKKLGLAHETIPLLEGRNIFLTECYFKKIIVEKNGLRYEDVRQEDDVWQDYPPNAFAWPIFSERFMSIIDSNISGNECIDWINVNIEHFEVIKPYYMLRFNKLHDVLDIEKTTYVKGTDHIIVPTFKSSAFEQYHIATIPSSNCLWKITSDIYVSEKMRQTIKNENIKEVEFGKCRISE
jgi:hypothetical protein